MKRLRARTLAVQIVSLVVAVVAGALLLFSRVDASAESPSRPAGAGVSGGSFDAGVTRAGSEGTACAS